MGGDTFGDDGFAVSLFSCILVVGGSCAFAFDVVGDRFFGGELLSCSSVPTLIQRDLAGFLVRSLVLAIIRLPMIFLP